MGKLYHIRRITFPASKQRTLLLDTISILIYGNAIHLPKKPKHEEKRKY